MKSEVRLTKYHLVEHLINGKTGHSESLVLNTYNSKFYRIDTETYFQISKGNVDSLSAEQFHNLFADGLITIDSPEIETSRVIRENQLASSDSSTLFIVLQASSWCQLGCSYCGQTHKKGQSLDVDKIISFIERKIEVHQPIDLCISWFGSEPTLAIKSILDISKILKKVCGTRGIIFHSRMTTNGLLLNRKNYESLVNEANCRFFEITIDGLASSHNKSRPTKSGKETFATIMKNLQEIVAVSDSDTNINVRCNVDSSNMKDAIPLLQLLSSLGLAKKIKSIYLAPIHSWGNEAHLRALDSKDFANLEIDFIIEKIKLGIPISLIPHRKLNLCLATMSSGYLVDPAGEIYKCSEVSLVDSYLRNGTNLHSVGNIENADQISVSKFSSFHEDVLNDKYPCKHCELLPLCGGRCPKEWMEGRVPCPSVKENINQRMILQSLLPKMEHSRTTGKNEAI